MTKKIFSSVAFIFALSLAFAENIETIKETDSIEAISDNDSPIDDEKHFEIQENGENVETPEEDL